jgi:hypothetical protein
MKDVDSLLEECQALGARFEVVGDTVKVRAREPLPQPLLDALRAVKPQLKARIQAKYWAGSWILDEWRRISIPDWRRILMESIEKKKEEREKYARWMLREVLEDPEYREPEQ